MCSYLALSYYAAYQSKITEAYGSGHHSELYSLRMLNQCFHGFPGKKRTLTLRIDRADGERTEVEVVCRLDTPTEVEYYLNGGILNESGDEMSYVHPVAVPNTAPATQPVSSIAPSKPALKRPEIGMPSPPGAPRAATPVSRQVK